MSTFGIYDSFRKENFTKDYITKSVGGRENFRTKTCLPFVVTFSQKIVVRLK